MIPRGINSYLHDSHSGYGTSGRRSTSPARRRTTTGGWVRSEPPTALTCPTRAYNRNVDRPPPSGPVRLLVHLCFRRHCGREVERSGTGRRQWRCRRFRSWRSIAQAAVWTDGVVVPPPPLDQHLGFGEAVEDLAVEQFVAKRPVEAFVIAVLPWRARRDVERLHAELGEPDLHGGGDELRSVI